MSHTPHRLGQLLLRRKAITEAQLQEALTLQQRAPQPLGQALMALGYVDEKILSRTLRQQRWLRPCAACFALIAPFSASYAAGSAEAEAEFSQEWLHESKWWPCGQPESVGDRQDSADVMKFLALTAWEVYQGSPQAGEIRYNLSNPAAKTYQLEFSLHF